MRRLIVLLASLLFATSHQIAAAQVKTSLECKASGLKASGEKSTQPFVERFQIDSREHVTTGKDGKPEKWGISNAELISDGMKQKPSLVSATPEFAVLVNTSQVGSGYNRRLLVFTYMLDLQAMQLTRVVNSLPAGADERTQGSCSKK